MNPDCLTSSGVSNANGTGDKSGLGEHLFPPRVPPLRIFYKEAGAFGSRQLRPPSVGVTSLRSQTVWRRLRLFAPAALFYLCLSLLLFCSNFCHLFRRGFGDKKYNVYGGFWRHFFKKVPKIQFQISVTYFSNFCHLFFKFLSPICQISVTYLSNFCHL